MSKDIASNKVKWNNIKEMEIKLEDVLQCAYNGPSKIAASKMRDLMSLCERIVPPEHREFYRALKETNDNIAQDVESDEEAESEEE